jgi:crotonobetainyl-CoA:carnitine CoA-transferase CaiB-like acyl-CoA transferase
MPRWRRARRWNGKRCSAKKVPCAAAREVEDMFDFPQAQAEALVTRFEHPAVGSYRGFAGAWMFDRTPGPAAFAAPTLDQHGEQIRTEADRLRGS